MSRNTGWSQRILVWALLALILCGTTLQAQTSGSSGPFPDTQPRADQINPAQGSAGAPPVNGRPPAKQGGGSAPASLDYKAWASMAERAEAATVNRNASSQELDQLRSQLADWREALLGAQSANSTRIATLRDQIAALGPVPTDAVPESVEIARRRSELTEQLVRLQAPGIAADEAYQRADGLIREIDTMVRERKTTELLKLWPVPVNPTNWPEALGALSTIALRLFGETAQNWASPSGRTTFWDHLPLIVLCLAFAAAVFWRGGHWIDRGIAVLQGNTSPRARRLRGFFASLGLVIIPTLGILAVAQALDLSGMLGPVGLTISHNLGRIGVTVFAAIWLGALIFPAERSVSSPLAMSDETRAEGRFLTTAFGLVLAIWRLRRVTLDQINANETATSVLSFPLMLIGAVLLFRMGQLLRRQLLAEASGEDGWTYRSRLLNIAARIVIGIAVIGPVLAAFGYISAAAALINPAALSLSLVGLLVILQRLAADIYGALTHDQTDDRDALIPVLVGFGLTLVSLPVFALIWGARQADLTELWARFREGFQMGETRISPTDFLFFAVIFGIGMTLTRLLQGALKTTVLPRTGLDQGGQNAVVSGLGYVGIFLAGLIAINAAGIDLSGLAIVAGALSVGIGFGLQTVVSNFVSGIILLVERPVSEGDWIEVGNVQGIVKSISVRSTRIQTFDRSDVIVPNSDLISGRVTNWTRFSLSGRLTVPVTVPFTNDSRKVDRILREIAEAQPLAVLNPPPVIALMGFGGDAMNFEIRVILRDVNFIVQVRSEINHQIAARFAAEGIVFTNTHRDYLAAAADAAAADAEATAESAAHEREVVALLGPHSAAASSFRRHFSRHSDQKDSPV